MTLAVAEALNPNKPNHAFTQQIVDTCIRERIDGQECTYWLWYPELKILQDISQITNEQNAQWSLRF